MNRIHTSGVSKSSKYSRKVEKRYVSHIRKTYVLLTILNSFDLKERVKSSSDVEIMTNP